MFSFTSAFPDRCANSVPLSLYGQITVWEVTKSGTLWFYSCGVAARAYIMH